MVLGEIDAAAVPELIVVNKVDAMTEDDILTLRRALPGAVWVSARTGAGIDGLRELIADRLPHPDVDVEVLVPYDRGDLVARVHRDGEVLSERHEDEGTRLTCPGGRRTRRRARAVRRTGRLTRRGNQARDLITIRSQAGTVIR